MQTTKTSVIGAINMLGLAKRLKLKIAGVDQRSYGDPSVHPQTETYWETSTRSDLDPVTMKASAAPRRYSLYWRQHRLQIKVARIFNTYGPRTHPNDGRVVSSFIVQALLNQDVTIFGDGEQTRSFCYVDDLIRGLTGLMDTGSDVVGPINLGNPTEFTMRQLADLVLELTGSRSKIVHRPLPQDDPRQRRPDISEAQRLLGWRPAVSLKEGLTKTIPYFEELLAREGVAEAVRL